MFSLKVLIAILALSSVAAGRKKKTQYRVYGVAVPDESGSCYPGDYYDKSGANKLGSFLDCVVGAPEDKPNGKTIFPVVTTFTPDDPNETTYVTTCDITVTPETNNYPFNVREKCKSKVNGLLSPEGVKGGVSMKGEANNSKFPELTFNLLWTITEEKPKKTKKPVTAPPTKAPTLRNTDTGPPDSVPTGTIPPHPTRPPVRQDDD